MADNGNSNDTTLTLSGTAEAGSTVTIYDTDGVTALGSAVATGGNFTITTSVLGDGPHTLTARATDISGNLGSASTAFHVTIDTAAPAAPVITTVSDDVLPQTGVVADNGSSNDTTLTLTGTAETGSTVTIYDTNGTTVLGSAVAAGGAFTITTSPLSEGAHTLTAKATDITGNQGSASTAFHVTVDTTAPAAPAITNVTDDVAPVIGAVADNGTTNDTALTIAGTAEAGSTVTIYDTDGTTVLGSAIATGGNFTITTSALSQGAHTLTAKATDAAGNEGNASTAFHVTIDTSPPAPPVITDVTDDVPPAIGSVADNGSSNDPAPTITGTAEAGSTVTIYDTDGTTVLGSAIATGGNFTITTSALADGVHTLTAKATDAAGNQGGASTAFHVTITTTGPVPGVLSFTGLTDSGTADSPPVTTDNAFDLTLTGTDAGTTVVYQVSVNGAAFANTSANQSALSDGDYVFRAVVTDGAGNGSISNSIAVTIDNTPPIAGLLSFTGLTDSGTTDNPPVTTDNAFDLTLTGTEAGATVIYQVSVNGGAFTNTSANQSALADGNYVFQAIVTDAAGNISASNAIAVTVDNTPPTAGTLSFTGLADTGTPDTPPVTTDNAFDLTLTGAEAGTSVVYQVSVNGGAFATTTASQNALADGDYVFRALVSDAAGNSSTSNIIEVKVDTAAPASGVLSFSNLTDTGTTDAPPVTTDNAFDLTLAGAEAGTAVVYQVSVNGGAFATTTASQNALADGDYVFRALVTDAAGNSSTSNSIEVKVDTAAPAAGTLSFTGLTDTGTPDTPPVTTDNTFDLTLAGAEAGTAVVYQVSVNGGAFATTTASQNALADGDYVFRALGERCGGQQFDQQQHRSEGRHRGACRGHAELHRSHRHRHTRHAAGDDRQCLRPDTGRRRGRHRGGLSGLGQRRRLRHHDRQPERTGGRRLCVPRAGDGCRGQQFDQQQHRSEGRHRGADGGRGNYRNLRRHRHGCGLHYQRHDADRIRHQRHVG